VVKFIFFPLETKKTTFFAEIFKTQGRTLDLPDPLPTSTACVFVQI